MFMLRNIFGKVWSDPQASELAKIPNGQLFLIRSDGMRGSRECIFNTAMASIRRSSKEFEYQLAISRVFEEGEDQLLDEDEDAEGESSERAFLIDEVLEFRQSQYENEPSFIWKQPDSGDCFEFVATGATRSTCDYFEVNYLKAVYERKYQRSSENVNDEELDTLKYKPGKAKAPAGSITSAFKQFSATAALPAAKPARPPVATSHLDQGNVLQEESAQLYLWDMTRGEFVPEGDVQAQLVETNPFEFWILAKELNAKGGLDAILAHKVTPENNGRWSKVLLSFTWNNFSLNPTTGATVTESWCLKFAEVGSYQRYQDMMNICVWEGLNGMRWGRIKEDEQDYAKSSWQDSDIEMEDAEEVADDLEEKEQTDDDDSAAFDEDSDEDDGARLPSSQESAVNSHLAVGHTVDRSFVVRGSRIGVFKHTDDDKIRYSATINNIATPKGKAFIPKKVMLHDRDASMLMMDAANPKSIFRMDLERGQVVDEWKVDDDRELVTIAPGSKFAQTTAEQTLVGTSHNALFRIDPRQSGNKIADTKQYATKNQFSTVSTTQGGKIAVGSSKGELRLFDTIGKNAKTALPALGDPIIGLDTTADGRWVVATCKTYLMVVDTLIGAGTYVGKLGFDRSFPKDSKPIPKRLQLRPEHVAYMGSEVSFTPARFNTGPDQEESTIVTSSGPFVIAWDFKRVKAGKLDKYEIKQYTDKVVEDQFKFGNDKNIVVALSNDVLSIDKKSLQKPSRQSLMTPTRLLRSRNDIVDSRY